MFHKLSLLLPRGLRINDDLIRRGLVTYFISVLFGATGVVFLWIYGPLLKSPGIYGGISAASVAVCLNPVLLYKKESFLLCGNYLAGVLYFALTLLSLGYYGESVIYREWVFLIPFLAISIAGMRSGLFWGALILLQIPLSHFLANCCMDLPSGNEPLPILRLAGKLSFFLVLTVLTGLYEYFNRRNLSYIQRMSEQDELTGLHNRRGFSLIVPQLIKTAKRERKNLAFIYLDLDDFKQVNDRYGHAEGDQVLIALAHILKSSVREVDLITRLGGDEFLIAGVVDHDGDAHLLAQRILVAAIHHNEKSTKPYTLQISLGIIFKEPDQCADIDAVIREADLKMYENKRSH